MNLDRERLAGWPRQLGRALLAVTMHVCLFATFTGTPWAPEGLAGLVAVSLAFAAFAYGWSGWLVDGTATLLAARRAP